MSAIFWSRAYGDGGPDDGASITAAAAAVAAAEANMSPEEITMVEQSIPIYRDKDWWHS